MDSGEELAGMISEDESKSNGSGENESQAGSEDSSSAELKCIGCNISSKANCPIAQRQDKKSSKKSSSAHESLPRA